MNNKGMIIGFIGQKLDEKLKKKITTIIKTAVEMYFVTEFFFSNESEGIDEEYDVLIKEYAKTNEYIAKELKKYKKQHTEKNIKSVLIVAQTTDTNFQAELYDEVIQGYLIYAPKLGFEESQESFHFRDEFLVQNIDYIFWYSNQLLMQHSSICSLAKNRNAKVIVVE